MKFRAAPLIASLIVAGMSLTACGGGGSGGSSTSSSTLSAAAHVGESLFNDPILSSTGAMSCASPP